MTAQWISSGEPVPPAPLEPADDDGSREWHAGRFTFRRYRRPGRWSCEATDGSVAVSGAAGFRTPFGAFAAVLSTLPRKGSTP